MFSQDNYQVHSYDNTVYLICLLFDEYGDLLWDSPYTSLNQSLCLRSLCKYYILTNLICLILFEIPIKWNEYPIYGVSYTKQLLYNRWPEFIQRINLAYQDHLRDKLYKNHVVYITNLPDGCTDEDLLACFVEYSCRIMHCEYYRGRSYISKSYSNNRGRRVYLQFKDKKADEIMEIHNKAPFKATSRRGSGITQTLCIQVIGNPYIPDVFQGDKSGPDFSYKLA